MIRGYYTAASGIVTQERKLNTIANNIANVSTAGYKSDSVVMGTFGEHMAVHMSNYARPGATELGGGVFMQTIDEKYTDYRQGAFQATGRPLDLMLQGEGYFVVNDPAGESYLTRDGQFSLDEEGYLILPGFGRVQGTGGDIEIGTSRFVVDSAGQIYRLPEEDDDDELEEVDRLLLVVPTDYDTMEKTATGLFTADGYTEIAVDDTSVMVRQEMLEKSNVDMSMEMTRMITAQRSLQSASQIVRMYDEMNQKSTEQLGRVR